MGVTTLQGGRRPGLDPERLALIAFSLSPTVQWSPADALRLLRRYVPQDVTGTYRRLLDGGLLCATQTPFGTRLYLTAEAFFAAEQALRDRRPPAARVAPEDTPAPRPTLLHDLLTLAGLLVRDGGRLTGDGHLHAASLRRLEGLCLTQAEAVPRVARRTPPGTEVWQFLLRFFDALGWVHISAGQARLPASLLVDLAEAPSLLPVALALCTFAASRLPTAATAWFGLLGPDVPVRYPLRALSTWLTEAGIPTGDTPSTESWIHRGVRLLEATGLAVSDHRSVVLLPDAAQLWAPDPGAWSTLPAQPDGPSDPAFPHPIRLPDGRNAVDLVGHAALRTRAAWEAAVGPVEVGQAVLYPDVQTREAAGVAEIGIGAVCRVEDPKVAETLADKMGTALLARWSHGIVVVPYALAALERAASAAGLRVHRCVWTEVDNTPPAVPSGGDSRQSVGSGERVAVPRPALPWTLYRARQGVWRATDRGATAAPPKVDDPVPPYPTHPTPGAPLGAYLLWAIRAGRLVTIVPRQGGVPTVVLPLALRLGPSGETAEVLDPQAPELPVTIALSEIGDVRPYGVSQPAEASLTPAKGRE